MSRILPVVLAGGVGARLWPLSREEYPKQLLRLTGANTLLQETVMRLDSIADSSHADESKNHDHLEIQPAIVSCHEDQRFLTLEQLEAIDHVPQRIVLEPFGRNTAPALTVVMLTVLRESDGDPVVLVMPADHVITKIQVFHRAVMAGVELANDGYIVTFGVVPTHPHTGYGYIRAGVATETPNKVSAARVIDAFVEKPDENTAKSYLKSGDYFWNSGMFMLRASVWIKAISVYRPDILHTCEQAVDAGTIDGRFFRVDPGSFNRCESESIDYAVMEHLTSIDAPGHKMKSAVIPLDAGWSDVGSWRALLDLSEGDANGNMLQGDVFSHGSENCLLIADHRLLATVGIENLVVVETADAVLVADKDHTEDVRKVVDWLKKNGREESRTHRRVYRPWGYFELLDSGEGYQVKRLTVKPGAALSLQLHRKRAEHWVVVRGQARITCGDKVFDLQGNESTYIPMGTQHRLENRCQEILQVIEVQSGSYLGEDDIVRLDDRYKRKT